MKDIHTGTDEEGELGSVSKDRREPKSWKKRELVALVVFRLPDGLRLEWAH